MSKLTVTLIDVGWGDSILLESETDDGEIHYGLIDSNDTNYLRSSYTFLRRHFEKKGIQIPDDKPVFDFIVLTHAHTDHGQGLKLLMQYFGTQHFWYPQSLTWASLSSLINFANRSSNVQVHQSIDRTKVLPSFGDVQMKVLWPKRGYRDQHNENNNSIVLLVELGSEAFLLTGDAEEAVWHEIAVEIPSNVGFFKLPHHGSKNGAFMPDGSPAWLRQMPNHTKLGVSSHIRPFNHPSPETLTLLDGQARTLYRTDESYHLVFETDGASTAVRYHH